MQESDLLIVGAGPCGLSAAINAASEGLRVRLLDQGPRLGGQARESSAIENYAGFPAGITGAHLASRFIEQAYKFGVDVVCPQTVTAMRQDKGRTIFTGWDGTEYLGKATLLTLGLSYRRLSAAGIERYLGRGVSYGMPDRVPSNCHIGVIGGANSAGQAVVKLASNPSNRVTMIVRKTLEVQMSAYLVDRIRKCSNVAVLEHAAIEHATGKNGHLAHVHLTDGRNLKLKHLILFIGAAPSTAWLGSHCMLDPERFIRTWDDAGAALPYETSIPGVFAAGDVRSGSAKRIASGVGEGAAAIQMIHRRLG